VLEGLVRPTGRRGWVPAQTATEEAPSDLQSLARQSRDAGDRILALKGNGDIVAIDPDSYAETTVRSIGSDASRILVADTAGQDTVVATQSGSGYKEPEEIFLLRDDTVTDLPWPETPEFDVRWTPRGGDDAAPPGSYMIRLAWRLEDGTVGPASGPYFTETGDGPGFEATVEIGGYPDGGPTGGWTDRIKGLIVICHPEASAAAATDVNAADVPGYRVGGFKGVPSTGDKTEWAESLEGIIAGREYEAATMAHHDILAGAVYSYNSRIYLGDVGYDYEEPQLDHMVSGADAGSAYHLSVRVEIETNTGVVVRYADPIGFTTNAAQNVEVSQGAFWYRDQRARSFELIVSEDYSGDFDAATWKLVGVPGIQAELNEAASAQFAYAEPLEGTVDITAYEYQSGKEITDDSSWSDQLEAEATSVDDRDTESTKVEKTSNASLQFTDAIASSEVPQRVRVQVSLDELLDVKGGGYANTYESEVIVTVEDGNGNTLKSDSRTNIQTDRNTRDLDRERGSEGPYESVIEIDDFDRSAAETLRIETRAVAYAEANGGQAEVTSIAEVLAVLVDVVDTTGGKVVSTNRYQEQDRVDRKVTRLVWSKALRPLDLPIENLAYIGESDEDPILHITSNASSVSEGQFGQYPLLVFGASSIWTLEVEAGGVQALSPITTDLGIVGRKAVTNANGPIYAATTRGVARFTPQLDGYASTPLHDDADTFLGTLGPGTELGFYTADDRQEVWVAGSQDVYVFARQAGAWSTLPITRQSLIRLQEQVYGVNGAFSLTSEGTSPDTYQSTLETAATEIDTASVCIRVRDVWLVKGGVIPGQSTQLLHVRGVADGAWGMDYTTDLSSPIRVARGYAQGVSVYMKADMPTDVTVVGVGIEYEGRDVSEPRSPITEPTLLGPGASESQLQNDLPW
jgi:hypothetical protein